MLESNYKFYISFENSLCSDYVTEKFFNILKYNIIPITLNGVDMSEIAPPNSYIDFDIEHGQFKQGQLQIWTERSHADIWKSETSREIKKTF